MSTVESIAATQQVHDTCLCFRAQKAARAMARRFDAALRPFGLTSGQFSLLNAANRDLPATMSEIAGLLGADRTTLTAAVKPLARRGLLLATVDDHDRRGRRLSVTAEGRALLAKATPAWRDCHQALDAHLGQGGVDRLRRDLESLAAG